MYELVDNAPPMLRHSRRCKRSTPRTQSSRDVLLGRVLASRGISEVAAYKHICTPIFRMPTKIVFQIFSAFVELSVPRLLPSKSLIGALSSLS
jgi:hypothetical protein